MEVGLSNNAATIVIWTCGIWRNRDLQLRQGPHRCSRLSKPWKYTVVYIMPLESLECPKNMNKYIYIWIQKTNKCGSALSKPTMNSYELNVVAKSVGCSCYLHLSMCCHSKSLCLCFETACLLVTHVLCHTTHITYIAILFGGIPSLFATHIFDSCWFSCPSISWLFLNQLMNPQYFTAVSNCEAPISRSWYIISFWSTLISWSLHPHPRARCNPTISSSQLIFETSCFMLKLGCGVASLYQVCGVPFHFALHHCFRLTKNTGNTVSTSNLGGNGQCRFFR